MPHGGLGVFGKVRLPVVVFPVLLPDVLVVHVAETGFRSRNVAVRQIAESAESNEARLARLDSREVPVITRRGKRCVVLHATRIDTTPQVGCRSASSRRGLGVA